MLTNFIHQLLQYLLWYIIKLLYLSYRVRIINPEQRESALSQSPHQSFIFAVWHEQVVAVMRAHAWTRPYLALASRSKDGDYAAFVTKKIGFIPVRGSSRKRNKDKGGKEALSEYIQKMSQGTSGGITVDGPKGPRRVCKPGVVMIAKVTGCPILPVAAIANRYWEFNSWDKFKIPKPFASINLMYGEPVFVPSSTNDEEISHWCHKISDKINLLEEQLLQPSTVRNI